MRGKACLLAIVLRVRSPSAEAHSQPAGRDIMQKQKDLHKSKSEIVEQNMVLVDKSGKKEVRVLRNYIKEVEPNVHRILVVFLSPADVKGTALLTWQHRDQEDDQWLYLPALGKMQRIARSGKKNYFMGTDFTYEDMQTIVLDDYTFTLSKEEALEGSPCYVVEAVPANAQKQQESAYSKKTFWVTRDHYTILKVEFYDRKGTLVKTQINRDWVNVKGTVWRSQKTLMDNLREKHQTLVGVTRMQVNQEIDDQTFSERFILTGKHIQ